MPDSYISKLCFHVICTACLERLNSRQTVVNGFRNTHNIKVAQVQTFEAISSNIHKKTLKYIPTTRLPGMIPGILLFLMIYLL